MTTAIIISAYNQPSWAARNQDKIRAMMEAQIKTEWDEAHPVFADKPPKPIHVIGKHRQQAWNHQLDRVHAALRPGPMRTSALAEMFDKEPNAIRKILHNLQKKGMVERELVLKETNMRKEALWRIVEGKHD